MSTYSNGALSLQELELELEMEQAKLKGKLS